MVVVSRRQAALRGFGWGAIAGLALVALMYLAALLIGLRPLPQLLNQPLLSLMPGFVFGFLIDTLQHAGKVVEEFGLIVAMVVALGLLGSAWAMASRRWSTQYLALMFGGIGWLVVVGVLLPLCGVGFLGLNDGPTTPLVWGALFGVYSVVLQLGRDTGRRAGCRSRAAAAAQRVASVDRGDQPRSAGLPAGAGLVPGHLQPARERPARSVAGDHARRQLLCRLEELQLTR